MKDAEIFPPSFYEDDIDNFKKKFQKSIEFRNNLKKTVYSKEIIGDISINRNVKNLKNTNKGSS